MIVSLLTAAVMVGSLAAVVACAELDVYDSSREEALQEHYDRYSEIYSTMALAWREDEEQLEELSKTNFRYGIIKAEDIGAVDLSDPASYETYNFETMPKKNAVAEDEARAIQFEIGPNTWLGWDCSLFGYSYTYGETVPEDVLETYEEPIIGYYYNVADGIFYYETEDAYYRVDTVGLPVGVGDEYVNFVYDSGQGTYYNQNRDMCTVKDYYLTFDRFDEMSCSWETWYSVNLDNWTLLHTDIRFAEDARTKETGEFNGKPISKQYYVAANEGTLELKVNPEENRNDAAENNKKESYWVVSQVRDPLVQTGIQGTYLDGDLFEQITYVLNYAYTWRYWVIAVLVVSALLWAVSMVLVLVMAGHKGHYRETGGSAENAVAMEDSRILQEEEESAQTRERASATSEWVDEIRPGFWQKIPLDVETCMILVAIGLFLALGMEVGDYASSVMEAAVAAACFAADYLLAYLWLVDFVIRVKVGKWWRSMLLYKFFAWLWRKVKKVFGRLAGVWKSFYENRSLLWKAILILGGLCFLEFCGILITGYEPEAEFIIWLLYRIVTVALILVGIVQANKLKKGAGRLAEGDLSEKVDTEKMFWEFKKHGETLNRVGDGISLAVEKRMQSEHFRTELITNVSHDIKTPLTSIINYVDLLQKEELHNEKAKEYLEVLDRQSARLKKLMEDLVEASKASTGSMPVKMERLELGVFLTQTVGEFEERFEAAGLRTVMHKPETEIFVMADGRHLWRVVENLVQNICKYAQPDTRVYIDLDEREKEAVISFKNISRYELNISGEALMERFVRGDASRHTEGSGLGLSIAGSLMELMGGKLEIVVDGDLFKVVLHFPK